MNEPIEIENNKDYEELIKSIENIVSSSKNKIANTINDEMERNFYIAEASKEKWSKRTLKRQMESGLFLKLAVSKNKNEILTLAKTGQEINEPKDIIKSIYTLDFFNIEDKTDYSESQLEEKIIEKLEDFLLELGKGFTFVRHQYPIHIGNDFYHADLVFYHRILKCFVIGIILTRNNNELVVEYATYNMDTNLFQNMSYIYQIEKN